LMSLIFSFLSVLIEIHCAVFHDQQEGPLYTFASKLATDFPE
jgi:hypothetical protein